MSLTVGSGERSKVPSTSVVRGATSATAIAACRRSSLASMSVLSFSSTAVREARSLTMGSWALRRLVKDSSILEMSCSMRAEVLSVRVFVMSAVMSVRKVARSPWSSALVMLGSSKASPSVLLRFVAAVEAAEGAREEAMLEKEVVPAKTGEPKNNPGNSYRNRLARSLEPERFRT